MKLYATVTSERASKGQGGKEIEISIFDENQEKVAQLLAYYPQASDYPMLVLTMATKEIAQDLLTSSKIVLQSHTKGKQQKGETLAKKRQNASKINTHIPPWLK